MVRLVGLAGSPHTTWYPPTSLVDPQWVKRWWVRELEMDHPLPVMSGSVKKLVVN